MMAETVNAQKVASLLSQGEERSAFFFCTWVTVLLLTVFKHDYGMDLVLTFWPCTVNVVLER